MKFMTIVSTLLAATLTASAAPHQQEARDIWNPKWTYPTKDTVWNSGETHKVTWDTSDAPKHISGTTGYIILRTYDTETPLIIAHGFDLRDGNVSIKVPDVYTGNNYSLVLFGDSDNWSESFTINGPQLP